MPLSQFMSMSSSLCSIGFAATMAKSVSWASRTLLGGVYFDADLRFEQLELDQKWATTKIDWVHLPLLSAGRR